MHVVIIGNGISGSTAARKLRTLRPDIEISMISAESDYFYSRTALMYIYMGHMNYAQTKPYEDSFWDNNNIRLIRAEVRSIDYQNKSLTLSPVAEITSLPAPPESLSYDRLVLALGSDSNVFNWPGVDLKGVGGLYSLQDLAYMEKYSPDLSRAVIVGGGLIGIEMAEMFHSRHIPVTMLVRESNYWSNVLPPAEASLISQHIREQGIDLRLSTELSEILSDDTGRCRAVRSSLGEEISCEYVGLTVGVHPRIELIKEGPIAYKKGILVDDYLRSSVKDIYAIGDCAELRYPRAGRRAIEAVWYTGRMMGEVAAYNIAGYEQPYDPGRWFNSAKFFDIEYQVYGDIATQPSDDIESIYWQHPEGRKSIRINYAHDTRIVLGFCLLGTRYRQEVCTRWIDEECPIEQVLSQLEWAEFDPEFYRGYAPALRAAYAEEHGDPIAGQAGRKWNSIFSFLHRNS